MIRFTPYSAAILWLALLCFSAQGCRRDWSRCQTDRDCPRGYSCQQAQCKPKVQEDASRDASHFDSSMPDATGVDRLLSDLDLQSDQHSFADVSTDTSGATDAMVAPDAWSAPDSLIPDNWQGPDSWRPDNWQSPDSWSPPALVVMNPSFEADSSTPTGWSTYLGQCSEIHVPPTFGIDSAFHGANIFGCVRDWVVTSGGIYQQVSGALANTSYRATVQTYQHATCPQSTTTTSRIGVDPMGGTIAAATRVQWSAPQTQDSQWAAATVDFVAADTTVTLFLAFSQSTAIHTGCGQYFAINYFDLVAVDPL